MKLRYLLSIAVLLPLSATLASAQTFYVTDKVLVGVYEKADTSSKIIKPLQSGTPIEILKRSKGFAKVRSADGTTGWIENSYLIDYKPSQLVVLELTDQKKQISEQLSLSQAELEATQKQLVEAGKTGKLSGNEQLALKTKEVARLDALNKELDKKLAAANKQLENNAGQQQALQAELADAKKQGDTTTIDAKYAKKITALQTKNTQLANTLNQIRETLGIAEVAATKPMTAITPGIITEGGIQIKLLWLGIGIIVLLASGFIIGIKWLDARNLRRHGGFRI